jgi:hypothetical protein
MSMMRRIAPVLGFIALCLVSCEGRVDITSTPPGTALVRFINASTSQLDVAINGLVSTATDSLNFGNATGCLVVNSSTPGLSFRTSGTATDLAGFTPSFTTGGKYSVVAVTGTSGVQFLTVQNNFTVAAGAAAIAGLNAVNGGGPYDLHVSDTTALLGTTTVVHPNLAFGVPSAFANHTFATPPGRQRVQFTDAGTTTIARTHGNVSLVSGTQNIAIVGPPASGQTALRSIFNGGC